MSMHGGPTNDPTVRDLPLSDPRCNSDSCLEFKAAHEASQAAVSYADQFLYGHYVTYLYLGVIALAALYHASRLYANRRPSILPSSENAAASKPPKTSLGNKLLALARSVSYRRFHGRFADYLCLPPFGILTLILAAYLASPVMSFAARPYYRARRGYGSPPLGVRTGLMAQALTPLIVALAGKANIVSALTGVDHAKLNALHRHASYLCLFLSIVHTVPFLVAPYQFGGARELRAQYYKKGKPSYEYTGTPPLGILVGICLLSTPWLRRRAYNLFYRLHIPLYVTYLGLMFWHAGNQRDSWAYLWATLALWLASTAARAFTRWQTFHLLRGPWFAGAPAALTPLEGGMTRVEVLVHPELRWRPAAHCWLRFPALSLPQNHPFTIASPPPPPLSSAATTAAADPNTLTFYVRAYDGLTGALAARARSPTSSPTSSPAADPDADANADPDAEKHPALLTCHVDGPYGGLREDVAALYDALVCVAGGGGVSACVPVLLGAAARMAAGAPAGRCRLREVVLVWVVRRREHLAWVRAELAEVRRLVGDRAVLRLFVTGEGGAGEGEEEVLSVGEKGHDGKNGADEITGSSFSSPSSALPVPELGRPFLPDYIPQLVLGRRRVMIVGCGPKSMKTDVGNAAAGMQARVWRGEAERVSLHTETFGW